MVRHFETLTQQSHPSFPALWPSLPPTLLHLSPAFRPLSSFPPASLPRSPHPSTTPNRGKTGGRSPFPHLSPNRPSPTSSPQSSSFNRSPGQSVHNRGKTAAGDLPFPHLSPPFPPFPPHLSPPPQSSSFNRSPGQSVHKRGKTAGSGGASRGVAAAAAAAPEAWLPESAVSSGASTASPSNAGVPKGAATADGNGRSGIGSSAGVGLEGRREVTDRGGLRGEDSVPLLPKRLHFDQLSAPTPGLASLLPAPAVPVPGSASSPVVLHHLQSPELQQQPPYRHQHQHQHQLQHQHQHQQHPSQQNQQPGKQQQQQQQQTGQQQRSEYRDVESTDGASYDVLCWACGLCLSLPSFSPNFKCGYSPPFPSSPIPSSPLSPPCLCTCRHSHPLPPHRHSPPPADNCNISPPPVIPFDLLLSPLPLSFHPCPSLSTTLPFSSPPSRLHLVASSPHSPLFLVRFKNRQIPHHLSHPPSIFCLFSLFLSSLPSLPSPVGGILTTFPIICPLHPPVSHRYPPPPHLLPVPLPFLLHALITLLLSLQTIFNFLCSAFFPAGPVTRVAFGSADMPTVSAGSFDGWQLCRRCDPPRAKPPGAHHCSSCGTCVMDMDHHCPFIGNCVGRANQRHFLLFLLSTIISCIYVALMASATLYFLLPALDVTPHMPHNPPHDLTSFVSTATKAFAAALWAARKQLAIRAFIAFYLFIVALGTGISVSLLLYQQLDFILSGEGGYVDALKVKKGAGNNKSSEGGVWIWQSMVLVLSSFEGP
ncbi:unnamed protein product [Closterium sp. Naga37s-1]|nr:unnamed protein product [Closterium sp. Naga37s-1]